jgi:hypothetical protein
VFEVEDIFRHVCKEEEDEEDIAQELFLDSDSEDSLLFHGSHQEEKQRNDTQWSEKQQLAGSEERSAVAKGILCVCSVKNAVWCCVVPCCKV